MSSLPVQVWTSAGSAEVRSSGRWKRCFGRHYDRTLETDAELVVALLRRATAPTDWVAGDSRPAIIGRRWIDGAAPVNRRRLRCSLFPLSLSLSLSFFSILFFLDFLFVFIAFPFSFPFKDGHYCIYPPNYIFICFYRSNRKIGFG